MGDVNEPEIKLILFIYSLPGNPTVQAEWIANLPSDFEWQSPDDRRRCC